MKTRISNRSEALVLAISAISAIALAGAIAVVLLGSPKPRLVPGQQGPSSPVGQPITVISWNICSDVRTWCPSGGEPEVLAEAITETIRTHEPDAVFLQEVCSAVVTDLRRRLGPEWMVHFRKTRELVYVGQQEVIRTTSCSEPLGDIGIAIGHTSSLARSGSASIDQARPVIRSHPLPSPTPTNKGRAHQRLAMCVQLNAPGLQFCNAHLPTRGEDPSGQLRAAGIEILAEEISFGQRVGLLTIAGGDLNTRPTETVNGTPILARLYDTSTECDSGDDPQPTFKGEKIDYIFAGWGSANMECRIESSTRSDHDILLARIQLMQGMGARALRDGFPLLLEKAYARADRQRPNALLLTTALQRGFNNVEVDVQPPTEAGSFPLGTNKPDPWGRTLEDYYLYPLQQWVNAQQGKIHPESQGPFTLMVDIRSSRLTENVYRSLERNLTPYKPMLSRVEEGKVVPGPIRVVVPNSAALVRHLADRSSSLFFVDVRAPWRAGEAAMPPSVFVAMASVRLSDVTGEQMDLTRVAGEVKRAHDLGYAIRFYGYEHLGDSPEIRRIWAALEAADADFITTDDLDALVRALAR